MSDNLTVFGTDYTGVTGIKAKGTGNGTLTYIRPSGTKSITENGTDIDVASYASVNVAVPSPTPSLQSKTVTPTESQQTITADSEYDGLGTVTVDAINSTYVGSGISTGTIVMLSSEGTHNNDYYNLNFTQIDGGPFYSANGQVQAYVPRAAMGSATTAQALAGATFTSSAGIAIEGTIETKNSNDLTVSSATITVPAGYYASQASKTIASGTAGTPSAIKSTVSNHAVSVTPSVTNTTGYITGGTKTGTAVTINASELVSGTYTVNSTGTKDVTNYANISVPSGSATAPSSITGTTATVSTGTNTLTLTKSVSVTPSVTAGYVSSGTAGNSSVSLTANVTTKAAATITPGTTNQTIAAGTYITGTQTIAGDADLVASNIISTANIFGVQGSVVVQNYYTGSSAPSSSLGQNGDIYIQQ